MFVLLELIFAQKVHTKKWKAKYQATIFCNNLYQKHICIAVQIQIISQKAIWLNCVSWLIFRDLMVIWLYHPALLAHIVYFNSITMCTKEVKIHSLWVPGEDLCPSQDATHLLQNL